MKARYLVFFVSVFFISFSCEKNEPVPEKEDIRNDLTVKSDIITQSFVGNGVQWGGYDLLEQWTGSPTLSASDWEKLFQRVRFMRPPLVRIMGAPGWNYLIDGEYNPAKSSDVLIRILDFCEEEQILVMFGEWGHTGDDSIDSAWLENAANFIEWLLNTKGYTCIKYYNMVNEPNGDWSTINGNYSLWKSLIEQFHQKLVGKGIASKIKIIGPDVAIWDNGYTAWVSNTQNQLAAQVGAYDIHTYPNDELVHDGTYQSLVGTYRNIVPASKVMLMGEVGFKYSATSDLGIENSDRIAADKYASDDSNMFIYDAFYGIDMADAVIQNMRAGYAGSVAWDMDDAMYSLEGTNLKRWGFWNILGEERFENPADENIRPWFYTMSLMCRYFPAGSQILDVELPDKYGLRAVAGKSGQNYTIALVNSHNVDHTINLKMEDGGTLQNLKFYRFQSGEGSAFTGNVDGNGFATPESVNQLIDLSEGKSFEIEIPAKTFLLITNMD